MVAVHIGPDIRIVVVGAPANFATRSLPKKLQRLTDHSCINLRLPTYGGSYAWEFEKGSRELNARSAVGLALSFISHQLEFVTYTLH